MTKKEESEKIRREIVNIIENKPLPPSQILKKINDKLRERNKKPLWFTGLRKDYLNKLEKAFFIFCFKEKRKKGIGRGRGYSSYYIATKYIGEFKEFFDILLERIGEFIGDKKEIERKINKIIRLLSKLEVIRNPKKEKKWMTYVTSEKGKIIIFESEFPIKILNYKEQMESLLRTKKILERNLKNKTSHEEEKDFLMWIKEKESKDIHDTEFNRWVNEVLERANRWNDSYEVQVLSEEVVREIMNLIGNLDKQINLFNISNKIYKEMKK